MAKSSSTSSSRKRATLRRRKLRRERTPTVCTETDAIVPLQSTGKTPAFAEARLFAAGISSVGQIVYFDQTEANGGFAKMPTAIDPKQLYNEIAVGRTLDGRLSIAAQRQTGFSTQFITESKSSTSTADRWNKPVDLGKPKSVNFFKQLIVIRGVDGLDNVFGVDVTKGNVWWRYTNPPTIVTKTVTVTPPGSNTPMKIKVQETAPPKTAWSGWINLSGGDFDSIAATNNADGRIVLAGAHTNGKPFVSQQVSAQPFDAETWSKWDVPGGITNDGFGGMTANLDANGAVVLGANTAGGMMYLSRQDPPGLNTWSAWSQPGFIQDNVLRHDITIDGNGHLYIGVLNVGTKGTKNIIYGIQQTSVEYAQWTGWDRVAMIDSANQIDLAYNADGSIVMFAYDANLKELFYLNQVAVNSTEWFVEWTSIADGFEKFAIGRDLTPGPNTKLKSKRKRPASRK